MRKSDHFSSVGGKINQHRCNPITEQELWGIIIKNPEKKGYQFFSETPHFIVWVFPGTTIQKKDLEIGEAHIELMETIFNRSFDTKVQLFVYPTSELIKEVTGEKLLIRRDVMQLHIQEPARQLHEVVHLMTYHFFKHRSIPLLEEGIAEAYGNWSWCPGDSPEKLSIKEYTREHVHITTSRWLSSDLLPNLVTVLCDKDFRSYNGPLKGNSYVFAASFSLFIIGKYGMTNFLNLLNVVCNEDEAYIIQNKIKIVIGKDLLALEAEWRHFLRQK